MDFFKTPHILIRFLWKNPVFKYEFQWLFNHPCKTLLGHRARRYGTTCDKSLIQDSTARIHWLMGPIDWWSSIGHIGCAQPNLPDIVMSLPKSMTFIFELLDLTLLTTSWCPFKVVVPLKTNCLAGSSLSKVMKQKFFGASSRNLSTGRITSTTAPNWWAEDQNRFSHNRKGSTWEKWSVKSWFEISSTGNLPT